MAQSTQVEASNGSQSRRRLFDQCGEVAGSVLHEGCIHAKVTRSTEMLKRSGMRQWALKDKVDPLRARKYLLLQQVGVSGLEPDPTHALFQASGSSVYTQDKQARSQV